VDAKAAKKMSLAVPSLAFGASPLGSMPDVYGYSVEEDVALETIRAIFDIEPFFLDTSRNYGWGRSEERIGRVIRERGGVPAGSVLATKLDRDFETNRFDAAVARRSFEESLKALGVERIDILHLHDPEHCADLDEVTRKGGAIDELFRIKEEGLVGHVGLAMGKMSQLQDLLSRWDFDIVLSHSRFTLLNRQADTLFDEAHHRGISIFNAAPYASGVLAKGSGTSRRLFYQDATDEQLQPVRKLEDICSRYGVPLGAAALQFSMQDSRVTSTICGVSKPERVAQTLDWAQWPIPAEAWEEIEALPFETGEP